MAKYRYIKTNNGAHLALQRKALIGWRTVRYLDSDVRKAEEEMLAAKKKFEAAAKKRMEAQDKINELVELINKNDQEVDGAGLPFDLATGLKGWIKSLFKEPLYPEQKTSWKDFYNILKSSGVLKSVVSKATIKPTAVVVGTTSHSLTNPQQLTKAQRRQQSQQNNQQSQ